VQTNLPRINDGIRITPIRVVDQDGEMLGEMETHKARELAIDAGLDLVEVSPGVRPPVCRIMDFGKSQYEKQKKLKSGAKQHSVQVKQIRMRAKTGQHDVEVKVRKARQFLAKNDKVKDNALFRGRENAHHDRGRELLQQFIDMLEGEIVVEQPPRMESGRAMSTILGPAT